MKNSASNFAELLFGELALNTNAKFYVAFSGGMDSTALLHLMHEAQLEHGFSLTALHVNHNLHSDSERWANHCQSVCDALGVDFKQTSFELDDRSELAARNARYRWFSVQVRGGGVLLTAHHKQDRAETLLFNLMRGAGSRGLSSLRSVRPFHGAKLVRPLLGYTAQDIRDYVTKNDLTWVEDPSNQTDEYSRNKIRQNILPALTEFRADAISNIARAASNLEQENALLNEVAIADLVEVREMPKHPMDQSHAICYEDLAHLSSARQSNLLRFWLQSLQLHTPSKRFLARLLAAIEDRPGSMAVLQEEGFQFRFFKGYMYVMPALEEASPVPAVDWRNINQPVDLYGERLRVDATSKLRDLIQDRQPNVVRLAAKSFLHNPKALQGHSLNMKKWLQDKGIPPWRRQAMPLLTFNHADSDVVLCPIDQQLQSDWVSLECPVS